MSKKNNPSGEGSRKFTGSKILLLYDLIEQIPKNELPRIWNEVKDGIWSKELGVAPTDFNKPNHRCMEEQYVLERIVEIVGSKAVVRYMCVSNGFSDQLFDDWWESSRVKSAEKMGEDDDLEWWEKYRLLLYVPALVMSIAAIIISLVRLWR